MILFLLGSFKGAPGTECALTATGATYVLSIFTAHMHMTITEKTITLATFMNVVLASVRTTETALGKMSKTKRRYATSITFDKTFVTCHPVTSSIRTLVYGFSDVTVTTY